MHLRKQPFTVLPPPVTSVIFEPIGTSVDLGWVSSILQFNRWIGPSSAGSRFQRDTNCQLNISALESSAVLNDLIAALRGQLPATEIRAVGLEWLGSLYLPFKSRMHFCTHL